MDQLKDIPREIAVLEPLGLLIHATILPLPWLSPFNHSNIVPHQPIPRPPPVVPGPMSPIEVFLPRAKPATPQPSDWVQECGKIM